MNKFSRQPDLLSRMAEGIAGIRPTIERNHLAHAVFTESTLGRMSDFQNRAQSNPDAAAFMRVINDSSIQVRAVSESALTPPAKVATTLVAGQVAELTSKGRPSVIKRPTPSGMAPV